METKAYYHILEEILGYINNLNDAKIMNDYKLISPKIKQLINNIYTITQRYDIE